MENNNEEIWKDCLEYENVYQVSNYGRIKSKPVFIEHDGMWGNTGGFIKNIKVKNQTFNRDGYKTSKLCYEGKCRRLTVHRLVAKAFIPNPNKLSQVNHIDGNKSNNTVSNLEWISPSGNIKHAYAIGLMNSNHLKGEKHFKAKLTQNDVNDIRQMFGKNKIKEIAQKYNVSVSTITDIKYKKTWI